MALRISNFVCFQVAWCAAVFGAAGGFPLLGPAVVALWVAVHVTLSRSRRSTIAILIGAGVIGAIADSLLTLAGMLGFDGTSGTLFPVPLWMTSLWVNLAATLGVSLAFLRRRYALAAILGAVGGPLAYLAGHRLGALRLETPLTGALVAIGLEWAVAMPLLVALEAAARRWFENDSVVVANGAASGPDGPAETSYHDARESR